MKFNDYKNIKTDKNGFQFIGNNIMIDTEKHPCIICGCLSNYIEVFTEAYFCSDECVDKFYEKIY